MYIYTSNQKDLFLCLSFFLFVVFFGKKILFHDSRRVFACFYGGFIACFRFLSLFLSLCRVFCLSFFLFVVFFGKRCTCTYMLARKEEEKGRMTGAPSMTFPPQGVAVERIKKLPGEPCVCMLVFFGKKN